ncbi:hypothetical protein BGZ96_011180 [Linnemannia gamsii]|uniref:Uncharacterized protein n=1 Tax=Linnemannia gamsii TaxID=64522 RepID=A0ABQ7KEE6_9FUNG|nr:hypothetical protein BGZ96_011180 [Linnemannia gamsii]
MAQPQQQSQLPPQYRQALLEQQQRQQQEQQPQQQQQQPTPQTTTASQAPSLEQIEKQYSQLPPQYRQAILEKQQREHQMQMLQQQQQKLHGQSQQQLQQHQQQQQEQQQQQAPQSQPQRQILAPDSRRQQSASLASSPAKSSTASTSNRTRVASAPLTNTYRAAGGGGRDSDTASTYSVTSGPGRAHWKAIPLSVHGQDAVSSLVSLTGDTIVGNQGLDFNPSEGVLSRACVGCYEAFEQWQGVIPSPEYDRTYIHSAFRESHETKHPPGTVATTAAESSGPNSKKNTGQLPEGDLGNEVQPKSETSNIAIKRRPSKASQHILHNTQDFDKFLKERPAAGELVEKNILKDPKLAPALQQHAEDLKKSQLEDALNSKLEHRPPASELIDHNILHESNLAPGLQRQAEELKRSQLEDKLAGKLETRPRPAELVDQHILHASAVDSTLRDADVSAVDTLKATPLENFPSPKTLDAKNHI